MIIAPEITKTRTSGPRIYLDTCAIIEFYKNKKAQEELIDAMSNKKAVLCLSLLHIYELAKGTDYEGIGEFLNKFNLFCIEFEPGKVIQREVALKSFENCRDTEFCCLLKQYNHNLPKLLTDSHSDPRIIEIADRMSGIIFPFRNNEKQRDNAKKYFKEEIPNESITQTILNKIPCDLIRNKNKIISENECRDIFHIIVPVVYCDYVILDKYWANILNQLKLSNVARIAEIYKVSEKLKLAEALMK